MSRIIAFSNYKGGVGKTTSVVNTAHILALEGYKVLVVDMDPQGNSTLTLSRSNPFEHEYSVGSLLANRDLPTENCLVHTPYNVDLIPANLHTYSLVAGLPANSAKRIFGLRNKLAELAESGRKYDYILVDCPPQIEGALLTNAIAASNYYILPIEGESVYALQGVGHLMQAMEAIREDSNSGIRLLGALITMFDSRTTAAKTVREAIEKYFQDMLFKSVVRRNTAINKANLSNRCVCDMEPRSAGCYDYKAFAREMVDRMDQMQRH